MRAAGGVVGYGRLAIGAEPGLRRRSLRCFHFVHLGDEEEDDEGDDQKVDDRIDEAAVGDDGSAGFFGGFQSGILLAVEADEKIGEVRAAGQEPDGGHDDVVDEAGEAPPMITPTAMSTTLPRMANFLNSSKKDMVKPPFCIYKMCEYYTKERSR